MRTLSFAEQLDRARISLEEIDDDTERRFPGLREYAAAKVTTLEAIVMLQRDRETPELRIDEEQTDLESYIEGVTKQGKTAIKDFLSNERD